MTDIQIHSLVLSLEVAQQLMHERPDIYADIEYMALKHIFTAGQARNLSLTELASLLRCSAQEAADKMAAVRVRISYEQA